MPAKTAMIKLYTDGHAPRIQEQLAYLYPMATELPSQVHPGLLCQITCSGRGGRTRTADLMVPNQAKEKAETARLLSN